MIGNLPDNVSEGDPRAPWNAPDNPWDTGALEEHQFECNRCGFAMSGLQLATLEWDDRNVQDAGRVVHACPACVANAIHHSAFNDVRIGNLLMPHICGVTSLDCSCAEDEATDHAIDNMKENRYVH